MKRKFKIITAGAAGLALLAPIGTVIACGDPKSDDPKSDDPKMLSLDKFQELMLKSKLGPDKVATETQKASLKAIYDTLSLEKSKSFKTSIEETKEDGTKEEIKASYDIYLLSKKGAPLEVSDDEELNSYKENPKMSASIKEMYKSIRDNFVNEKNISKYLLSVVKYTHENGESESVAELSKIMKKENEIGGKEIRIFNKTLEDSNDKLDIIFKKIEKNSESKTDIDTFEVIIPNIKYPKFNDKQIQEINILAQITSANQVLGLYDREKRDHYGSILYKFKLTIGLQLIAAMEDNPTKNVSKIKFNGKYLGLKALIDAKNAKLENDSSSTKITSLLEYINRKINDEDIIYKGKTQQEMAKELMNSIRKGLKMNYTEKQGLQLFSFMNLLDNTLNKTNDEKMQKLYNKISSFGR